MTITEQPAAGRELDRLIADRVLGLVSCDGWERGNLGSGGGPVMRSTARCPHDLRTGECYPAGDGWPGQGPQRYSTEIRAAWQVVEHLMGQRSDDLVVVNVDLTAARFDPDEPTVYVCMVSLATPLDAESGNPTRFEGIEAHAETPALAICRAALKALTALTPEPADR